MTTAHSGRIESVLREHLADFDIDERKIAGLTRALIEILAADGDCLPLESAGAGFVSPYLNMTREEFAEAWSL